MNPKPLGSAHVDESQRQYRFLAEGSPHIAWSSTADGDLDYCNKRWFAYTGMTRNTTRRFGWEAAIHQDDKVGALESWRHSVRTITPFETQLRLKRASDGQYRWHAVEARPYRDATGSVCRWFGTCTDIDDQKQPAESAVGALSQLRLYEQEISARKRAEAALRASGELFRQVEEHAPIGLALLALGGGFIRVNPALCSLTGYRKDELLSMGHLALTHPEELDAIIEFLARTREDSGATHHLETRLVRKDGQAVWSLITLSLVRDEAREALYFIAQIQDISARKVAAHVAKLAQEAALSATDAKSRFLATMSHELRTPMNGIIGMLELLSLSQLTAEQSECVKVVRESSASLLRVLNDILDFSKIEAGKLRLESIDFELPRQIGSVVSLLAPHAKARNVSLTTHLDAAVPAVLKGDPGRLRQILINLVGNALKFSPAGGVVGIFAALETQAETALSVRFTVVDSGAGIPDEVRNRLFQPFSQLDDSTTRKFGGTGLGLAICKQLVDLMGGEIGVSNEQPGSSFWFVLPYAPGVLSAPPIDEPAWVRSERRTTVRNRSERLLLAEDNEVNARLATKQLRRLGFGVTVVANGAEAVKAIQAGHYQLVFMDCHMPIMDGLDATRMIRTLSSEAAERIPIVAMTANAQAEDRRDCLAAGMDDYLSKPVLLADLRTVIERWLPSTA